METLDNLITLAYVGINAFSVVQLIGSYRWPAIARVIFFLIFILAAIINTRNGFETPWVYQSYADYAVPLYRRFILGAFEPLTTPLVISIAAAQACIAVSMFMKGAWFRAGCLAGIIFCIAIAPLELGSAFPATLLLAMAFYQLFRLESRHTHPTARRVHHRGRVSLPVH
ncbi:hypothetical protein [Spirosoma sp. KNUC1025]|uniref:hypothetical protein n=1 Tax=Spirosoma sp. KNUC1025 TaxID=2894082 RepID=UPI0038638BA4|nr:hypothetical protein LN737_13960 [Spirosoma sp. KNUC1025]